MQLNDTNLTDSLDRALTSDIFDVSIACGALNVGTSAVVAKVGASNLTNRKAIVITNMSSNVVYWGCSNVSTTIGQPLEKKQQVTLTVGSNVNVYLISTSATNDTRIVELA